jgi:hypothetical protein
MALARTFLISCSQGVNRLGIEEPTDRISNITARCIDMVENASDCEDYKET